MFYQVGLLPVTNNLLDNSSDFYLIVYGMIRSDRLIIRGSCVVNIKAWLDEGNKSTMIQRTRHTMRACLKLSPHGVWREGGQTDRWTDHLELSPDGV